MAPLPSTRTIPARWSRHHRKTAAGGANASVRVYTPGDGPGQWDHEAGRRTPPEADVLYDGPARIQQLATTLGVQAVQAGQNLTGHRYLVQLDADLAAALTIPALVARVRVTAAADPIVTPLITATAAPLPGLVVLDAPGGSEGFTRDLLAVLATGGADPDANITGGVSGLSGVTW